jgi:hypothetical protein
MYKCNVCSIEILFGFDQNRKKCKAKGKAKAKAKAQLS